MTFWGELKRRNVFRVGIAYLVAAWVVVQIVGDLSEPLSLPDGLDTIVVVLLAIGFPVALIVAWIYEVTPEGIRVTSGADAASTAPGQAGRRLTTATIGLLIVAVGLMAVDNYVLDRSESAPAVAADRDPTPGTGTDNDAVPASVRIVVLDLEDATPGDGDGIWAIGITDQIREKLSFIDGLTVMGPDTTAFLTSEDRDSASDWSDLGVDYVLRGNVIDADDSLRVSLNLTDVDTGALSPGLTFDGPTDTVFEIMDEIARDVALAMQITLGVGEIGTLAGMTRDVRAYEAYLQSVRISEATLLLSGTDWIHRYIDRLQTAVSIDPDFALAWYLLSQGYELLDIALQAEGGDPAARADAESALLRAQELAPDMPELLLADLTTAQGPQDFFAIERTLEEFELALTEGGYPYTEVLAAQALFLYVSGRVAAAERLIERLHFADPLNVNITFFLSEAYAARGDLDGSLDLIDELTERLGGTRVPLLGGAVITALATGDEDEIARRLAPWIAADGDANVAGRIGELLDEPDVALEVLRDGVESGRWNPFTRNVAAAFALHLGDQALALELMRMSSLADVALSIPRPVFDDLRRSEAFKEFAEEYGFAEYWRESGNWPDYCAPDGLGDYECF